MLITENGSSNTFKISFSILNEAVMFLSFILDETLLFCLLFKASINISYIAVGIRGLLKQSSVQKIYNGLQGY